MKLALPTQLFSRLRSHPRFAYLFGMSTSLSSKSYCVIRGGCWAVGIAVRWLLLCGDLLLFSLWLVARCPSTHHGCCACACCCCCSLLVHSSVAWWLVLVVGCVVVVYLDLSGLPASPFAWLAASRLLLFAVRVAMAVAAWLAAASAMFCPGCGGSWQGCWVADCAGACAGCRSWSCDSWLSMVMTSLWCGWSELVGVV